MVGERELGGQASRGEPTLGRKQHQRGNCEPASAQASFKHQQLELGRGWHSRLRHGKGVGLTLAVCRAQVQSPSKCTAEAVMWPGTEAVWAGPASHTPSYHIWQKLLFSKFKDLISERAEEKAHGEWWPRSSSPESLGTVGAWLAHGCSGGPWGPKIDAHCSVHWPGASRGSGILGSRGEILHASNRGVA